MSMLRTMLWCFITTSFSCSTFLYLSVSKNFYTYYRHPQGVSAIITFQNNTSLLDGYTTRELYHRNSSVIKSTIFAPNAEVYVSGKTSKDWCRGLKKLYPLNLNFSKDSEKLKHFVPINNVSIEYEFDPERVCDKKKIVYILSIVISRVNNFKLRQAIRELWGNMAKNGSNTLIFTLGLSKDSAVQKMVKREFSTYGDILQGRFIDNYFNNTIKSVMQISWAASACRNSRFVLLVDDDVMVNFQKLKNHFGKISKHKETFLFSGNLKNLDGPMRNKHAKWFMSKYQFSYTCYPPYISGGAILTSGKVIKRISEALPYVKRFKYDDVYLGIIVQKLGIKPQRNVHVSMKKLQVNKLRKFIASHGFKNANEYRSIYRNFTQQ